VHADLGAAMMSGYDEHRSESTGQKMQGKPDDGQDTSIPNGGGQSGEANIHTSASKNTKQKTNMLLMCALDVPSRDPCRCMLLMHAVDACC